MAAEDYHADFFDHPRGHGLLDPVDDGGMEVDWNLYDALQERVKEQKMAKRTRKVPAKLRPKTQEQKDLELLANNKFYVGSPTALTRGWGHKTLAKALAHAEQVLHEQEEHTDFTFVVQIVRVVRRQRVPATVTKL